MLSRSNSFYSRFLVRHHWLVLCSVVFICVLLTTIGIVFTQFPDFSDPRIGWGARGKGTIFSQLMVLRHASEKFRRAYELPLDTNELFGVFQQFYNITVEDLDEKSYRSDLLMKSDLWKKKNVDNQLNDYRDLDDDFYENDLEEVDEDYDENSQAPLIYQWHRDRHFDIQNSIVKFVDDKMINITILDFIKNLPQFDKNNYRSSRLNFDLFLPYAQLIEEKYRGRIGRDGMIEFYMERVDPSSDLLSLDHLKSICQWEKKFKTLLSLESMPSLSLATFVALYSSKTTCDSITSDDVERFRSILHTCLPYYLNGYMDIPLSDQFLNRVRTEHSANYSTYQKQVKAVYATLRHTCFYKNITRFIFDSFVDKHFIQDLSQSKTNAQVSTSMIYVTNYRMVRINQTRDQTMCLRRQPYSVGYCLEHGCIDDYRNHFLTESCVQSTRNCEKYCRCKYQCLNETEQVIVLVANLKETELVPRFEKYFRDKKLFQTYRDEYVRLIALNLANVREKAAMVQIQKDMLLVAIAAVFIISITILYLRSISIALIIVFGAFFSLGVSYFIYRVFYQIPIFPYMNLMCAFLLIGIGCDDIFVFFDTWEQEKLAWLKRYQDKQQTTDVETPLNALNQKKIQPTPSNIFQSHLLLTMHNPDEIRRLILAEDALVEIMSNTLKHAASSMFVTSFTTAAAFFTNILTNISFVQVFGVFTGTCILIFFIITITAIAAFAIIYEKYIQHLISKIFYSKKRQTSSKHMCEHFSAKCKSLRNYIFNHLLQTIIHKCRYILVTLFLLLGVLGFIGVFYYPKLQVPRTQKVSFFLKDHPMEIYEFSMKSQFNGYIKEDKRIFAYPAVSFIFGIQDIDDGYIFDLNDRGHLHLMPIKLNEKKTLEFFKEFINHLGTRKDLFASNYDLEQDFQAFYQLTTDDILLTKVIDDEIKTNVSQTDYIQMVKYLQKINRTLVENLIRQNTTVNQNLFNPSNMKIISKKNRNGFNKILVAQIYRQQIEKHLNLDELRKILNTTYRDQLIEDYQRSALKTGMQCLTGAAGANNIPADFCDQQLKKQRSVNWAVLPDKPSPIDGSVRPFAVIITIRGAFNRTDYDSYNKYYLKIKQFFDPYIKTHAPEHFQHAWFSSSGFAFYGIQHELLIGSFSSLIASLAIALLVLFLTSGNLFIAIYALITIVFAIVDTVAIFAFLNWELGIVEAIIVIMSVGLSVDFVVHFGVGYIHTDSNDIENERKRIRNQYENNSEISEWQLVIKEHHVERLTRVNESISRVGSAVFMAAFTTFAAGFSMTLSSLSSFRHMGQFLMTIMSTSWIFAMFFFLPLCAIIGPVGRCGSIPFSRFSEYFKRCFRRN